MLKQQQNTWNEQQRNLIAVIEEKDKSINELENDIIRLYQGQKEAEQKTQNELKEAEQKTQNKFKIKYERILTDLRRENNNLKNQISWMQRSNREQNSGLRSSTRKAEAESKSQQVMMPQELFPT